MGTALTWPLTDNGHQVRLVGTHLDGPIIESCKSSRQHPGLGRSIPDSVDPLSHHELASALKGVDLVVSGVNSFGVHWLAHSVGPHLTPGQRILGVTKGLETTDEGDLEILPNVVTSLLPASISHQIKQAAIGGPCVASELARRAQTCVVFGSRCPGVADELALLFRTPYYRVTTTSDLLGLELCAAMKNAYAIAVGIASGVEVGREASDGSTSGWSNLPAAVFAQACTELSEWLAVLGAARELALALPGAGDLYVTCQGGRNSRLGRLLGLGHDLSQARAMMAGETLEGVATIRALARALPQMERKGRIAKASFPLMRALIAIVVEGAQLERLAEGRGWVWQPRPDV
jgi:glycerol-3-phosphate dehydrogenase (NAD(P)+)